MKTHTLKFNDKDYSLLQRIAKDQDRRIDDLFYLIFSCGLDIFFCETMVSLKKEPEEYTEEERAAEAKNKELQQLDGWHELDFDQRKEKGYKYVSDWLSNHERGEDGAYSDPLIDPLAQRIRAYALRANES